MASDGIVVCPLDTHPCSRKWQHPRNLCSVVFTNRILRLRSLSGTSLPSAQLGEETRFHEKTERIPFVWPCHGVAPNDKRYISGAWGRRRRRCRLAPPTEEYQLDQELFNPDHTQDSKKYARSRCLCPIPTSARPDTLQRTPGGAAQTWKSIKVGINSVIKLCVLLAG